MRHEPKVALRWQGFERGISLCGRELSQAAQTLSKLSWQNRDPQTGGDSEAERLEIFDE